MKDERYTAQEMREEANFHAFQHGNGYKVVEMLRQAAGSEEELQAVRSTWLTPETSKELFNDCVSLTKEIDELKARLDAVVKECEAIKSHHEKVGLSQPPVTIAVEVNRILHVARGEGV